MAKATRPGKNDFENSQGNKPSRSEAWKPPSAFSCGGPAMHLNGKDWLVVCTENLICID